MATKSHASTFAEEQWQRDGAVWASPWSKLMMWVFIITDGLLFAGFLASYGFARLASPTWPNTAEVFHLGFIALMTFILISSSATMATAVAAARRQRSSAVLPALGGTILGGLLFLSCQAYEWTTLIQQGASLGKNPWGVPLFSSYFFLITGFHGAHVLSGVVILSLLVLRWKVGKSRPLGVELAGLYWHFVDLVWVFIFTFFYLL